MDVVYHYTLRFSSHLGGIIRDGEILPEGRRGNYERGDRNLIMLCPAVWFSTNAICDATARKGVLTATGQVRTQTLAEFLAEAARIVVPAEVAPLSWADYKMRVPVIFNLTKKKREQARAHFIAMEKAGRAMGGDPAEWYCSIDPVRRDKWLAVELWTGAEWQPYSSVTLLRILRRRWFSWISSLLKSSSRASPSGT